MTSLWLDDAAVTTDDPGEALDGSTSYDDVVVGAGLSGLVTALLLARAGRSVIVLEARTVGAGTTGNTTGKVSLLQGTKLSQLSSHVSEQVCRAYLEANREGQAWLLRFCEENGLDHQRRDAVTYAPDESSLRTARREFDVAGRLGLDVRWEDELDVPFPHRGGVVLADQAQIHPMTVLAALAAELREHGGRIIEGARVVGASYGRKPHVKLRGGLTVEGSEIILATGTPILDRGLYFAKLEPHRSYALALEHPDPPAAMYLSAGSPTTSVRDAVRPDGSRLLLTGGFGHTVGRAASEAKHVAGLREWTARYFPDARETHAWGAQDYTSHDGIPYIGKLPRGAGSIYVLTGYDKWGMSNAVAASLDVAAQILGGHIPWARTLGHRVTRPKAAARLVGINVGVGIAAVDAIAGALVRSKSTVPATREADVAEGEIVPPVDASERCELLPVCTHLGGRLRWNDAEQSWDCPLHGSRFDPTGEVIEGPATRRLVTRHAKKHDGGDR